MPDVDLEMIESARLALKQERAENAHLRTENERLREALERIADTVDSDRFAPGLAIWCADEARSALSPPPAEEDERG